MKCYYHSTNDAVGLCKSCGRGICSECAVDLDKGLACRNHCEEEAKKVIRLVANSTKMQSGAKKFSWFGPTFFIVLGIIFAGYGVYCGKYIGFNTISGSAFIIFGIILALQYRKYYREINTD